MTRNTSLLTIPLAIVFGLTLAATSAGAGHSRSNCETRIFQGEDEACYEVNREFLALFRRGGDSSPQALAAPPGGEAEGFTLRTSEGGRFECGCQLRRKNDVICAGDGAVIGSVDRRARRASGEFLVEGEQTRFTAKRVDLEICQTAK